MISFSLNSLSVERKEGNICNIYGSFLEAGILIKDSSNNLICQPTIYADELEDYEGLYKEQIQQLIKDLMGEL